MDIFESPAQVIVNTVNTVGVMGKGIAKQYKKLYPEMFKEYQYFCENKMLEIGNLWIYKTEGKWVLNFPTKKHWRSPSKLEYIEEGLKKFVDTYKDKGIRSISFPPLGCGNGGLNWEEEVKPLMENYLKKLDINVYIHLPMDYYVTKNQEHKNINEVKKWLYSEPNSLSSYEVWEELNYQLSQESKIFISSEKFNTKINHSKNPIDESITLTHNESDNALELTKEEILETWKLIRQNGVLTGKMLPNHLKINKPAIFSILLRLPYIDSFVSVEMKDGREIDQKGIRLKPLETSIVNQEVLQL